MNTTTSQEMRPFEIVEHSQDSWWVNRCPLDHEGQPLPFSRPVFFARSRERALAWIEQAVAQQRQRLSHI